MKNGPIMVTGRLIMDRHTGRNMPHAVVVSDILGNGTPTGTMLTIYDPWPPNVAHPPRNVTYQNFISTFPEATTYILHR